MVDRVAALPFVGRSAQLQRLHEWLAQARAGRGRTITVVGPAGIGKSRLLQQLADSPEHAGVTIRATCVAGDPPFEPWRHLLRQSAQLAGRDELQPLAGEDPGGAVDLLLEIWAALPPPVLVVLDDLQDADAASLVLLRRLRDVVAGEPVVIAAALRAPRTGGGAAPVPLPIPDDEVVLSGLGAVEIRRLLDHQRTGTDPDTGISGELDAFAGRLLAATGGNPRALKTVLATSLPADPGGAPESDDPGRGEDPWRHALAQLDADGLQLLQLLALARQVPVSSLAPLVGFGPGELARALRRCQE